MYWLLSQSVLTTTSCLQTSVQPSKHKGQSTTTLRANTKRRQNHTIPCKYLGATPAKSLAKSLSSVAVYTMHNTIRSKVKVLASIKEGLCSQKEVEFSPQMLCHPPSPHSYMWGSQTVDSLPNQEVHGISSTYSATIVQSYVDYTII